MRALLHNALIVFLTALLQEDIAILSAGFFVVERDMPLAIAFAAVYSGMLTSNFLLYGLGMMARRLPWAQRWLIGAKVEHVRQRLRERLVLTVALCRLTPGLLFPTLLGCGWLGVSFARFALITAVTAVLYVPLMLMLVVMFGEIVRQRLSDWAWLSLVALTPAGVREP